MLLFARTKNHVKKIRICIGHLNWPLSWKMLHGLQQKDELIDYAMRSGAPLEVLENLQEIEDEGDVYDSIEDIWPDYPQRTISCGMKTNIKQ